MVTEMSQTSTSHGATWEPDQSLLDAAREIAPIVRAHNEEAERERRLSQPVLEALRETGLLRMIGPNKNDATGEEFVLTEAQVRALGRYVIPKCDPNVPTLVLLDEGDEVIDFRPAQLFYRTCAKVIVYSGGSHRFEHMAEALPEIRRLYESL